MLSGIVLNLDGSLTSQAACAALHTIDMRGWGPRIRIACGFRRFAAFERELAALVRQAYRLSNTGQARAATGGTPVEPIFFCGSGDFHHVSLAFCRVIREPVNLLVLDKHPDWIRPLPFLHCGSWLWHAASLPNVRKVFHVGGAMDFDNAWRHLAPWPMLREGRIVVFPAERRYARGRWRCVKHEPLRASPGTPITPGRLDDLLAPYREELAARPLYISLDKDVMLAAHAAVNWDSGLLGLQETLDVLSAFLRAASGRCAGMDVFGDLSPCVTRGLLQSGLAWAEHPPMNVDAVGANQVNSATNRTLLTWAAASLASR